MKLAKLVCYFFIIHKCPNLRSNFGNHSRLERFKMILFISKIFGSRGKGMEILTIIGVQKCQILVKSENWTNVYAFVSSKLIVINECLAYIHSLTFFLLFIQQKMYDSISETGPILPLVVVLFSLDYWANLNQICTKHPVKWIQVCSNEKPFNCQKKYIIGFFFF